MLAFNVRAYPLNLARIRQRPHQHILLACKICVIQDIIALTEDLMGVSQNKNSEIVEEVKEEKPLEPKKAKVI